MKKGLTILIILFVVIVLSACNTKQDFEDLSSSAASLETIVKSTEESVEDETQSDTIDINSMTNDEFANKIAADFSINDVSFKVKSVDDTIAFLETFGSDDIDIHIGFSDYGNNISISFVTDGSEDECYYVLQQALQSQIFNIPFDDQIDILAHYKVDEIDYQGETVRITETIKDNIRVIGMRL